MAAMPESGEAPPRGPIESLRSMGSTLAALAQTRLELALVELREEGERRKAMLVLGAVAGVFLTLALLLLAFLVVVAFWETHRMAAILGVTVIYGGVGFGALLRLRASQAAAPSPFEATLAELRKDIEALRGEEKVDE
jgi:uncharacterized membrane protein YqjE